MTKEEYLQVLDKWSNYYGFNNERLVNGLEVERMYKRTKPQLSKFGVVDTYCFVKQVADNTNADFTKSYSSNLMSYASRIRTGSPIGFGAMLVVYPLLIVDNISHNLYQYIKNYCPKHFAAAEFPSILDFNSGNVYYYPSTPVWGALYYSQYRTETNKLYSPHSWQHTGNKYLTRFNH